MENQSAGVVFFQQQSPILRKNGKKKKEKINLLELLLLHATLPAWRCTSTSPRHPTTCLSLSLSIDILEREEPTRALDPLVPMGGVVEPPLII